MTEAKTILEEVWWHGESYGTGLVRTDAPSIDEMIDQALTAIEEIIQQRVDEALKEYQNNVGT
jgi:hypothetical protein